MTKEWASISGAHVKGVKRGAPPHQHTAVHHHHAQWCTRWHTSTTTMVVTQSQASLALQSQLTWTTNQPTQSRVFLVVEILVLVCHNLFDKMSMSCNTVRWQAVCGDYVVAVSNILCATSCDLRCLWQFCFFVFPRTCRQPRQLVHKSEDLASTIVGIHVTITFQRATK